MNDYDYDKTISSKTKDIQALEAEIAALQGVETAEARAELARKQAELEEAQEDLQDTVYEHQIELSQDALDSLKDSLQEAFDNYFTDLSSDLDKITELMALANELTCDSTETITETLNQLLGYYGIDTVSTGVLTAAGYASGGKVDSTKYAWTDEQGSEIIIRKSDGAKLQKLNAGDVVLDAQKTANLVKMSSLTPDMLANSITPKAPNVEVGVSAGATINQNYDSLLRIDGNVDSSVISDVEAFAQQFYKGAYDYAVKQIVHDAGKVGIKVK